MTGKNYNSALGGSKFLIKIVSLFIRFFLANGMARPGIVTADGSRAIRNKAEAAKPQEVSVISKAELDRIRAFTKIPTKEE